MALTSGRMPLILPDFPWERTEGKGRCKLPYTDTGDRSYEGREPSSRTFGTDVSGIIEKWVSGWLDDRGLVAQLRMEGLSDEQILSILDEIMEG